MRCSCRACLNLKGSKSFWKCESLFLNYIWNQKLFQEYSKCIATFWKTFENTVILNGFVKSPRTPSQLINLDVNDKRVFLVFRCCLSHLFHAVNLKQAFREKGQWPPQTLLHVKWSTFRGEWDDRHVGWRGTWREGGGGQWCWGSVTLRPTAAAAVGALQWDGSPVAVWNVMELKKNKQTKNV